MIGAERPILVRRVLTRNETSERTWKFDFASYFDGRLVVMQVDYYMAVASPYWSLHKVHCISFARSESLIL
jgi:hypothetical protein